MATRQALRLRRRENGSSLASRLLHARVSRWRCPECRARASLGETRRITPDRSTRNYAPPLQSARMPFLRTVTPKASLTDTSRGFPFSVPVIRALETLEFLTPVTFLVGENGSGKSTLLEGLAAAIGSPSGA